MDIIYETRYRHAVQGQAVSAFARDMNLSRPTVRKYLEVTEDRPYQRRKRISRRLGAFEDQLIAWLEGHRNVWIAPGKMLNKFWFCGM